MEEILMRTDLDVLSIVHKFLKENSFDGLYNDCIGCACELSDLAPCDEIQNNCEAGIKSVCTGPADDDSPDYCEGNCIFHIGPK